MKTFGIASRQYAWFASAVLFLLTAGPVGAAGPKGANLVDTALAVNSDGPFAGAFDTLIAAVLAADAAVVETLAGNGQHTVFAPTDTAFEALGITPENLDDLLADGTLTVDSLTHILLYHVTHGRRYSGEVLASENIRILNGEFVQQGGGVLTDNEGGLATIIVVDVAAANGVIHAIDAVLIP